MFIKKSKGLNKALSTLLQFVVGSHQACPVSSHHNACRGCVSESEHFKQPCFSLSCLLSFVYFYISKHHPERKITQKQHPLRRQQQQRLQKQQHLHQVSICVS